MRMNRLVPGAVVAVGVVAMGAASIFAQKAGGPPAFSYEGANGPAHWGDLSPDYSACKAGKQQSPIDIRGASSAALPALRFGYHAVPLQLINNGHTVQENYPPGSFLNVGGDRYELKQFHFHHPSEERISGRAFDMVIHLVHTDSQGRNAVVSVLVTKGPANSALEKVVTAMPKTAGKASEARGVEIDAASLLPANHDYYTYKGSLTTPPCTEGVTWFILKNPVTASAEQIQAVSSAFHANARPTQPLDGRVVTQTSSGR